MSLMSQDELMQQFNSIHGDDPAFDMVMKRYNYLSQFREFVWELAEATPSLFDFYRQKLITENDIFKREACCDYVTHCVLPISKWPFVFFHYYLTLSISFSKLTNMIVLRIYLIKNTSIVHNFRCRSNEKLTWWFVNIYVFAIDTKPRFASYWKFGPRNSWTVCNVLHTNSTSFKIWSCIWQHRNTKCVFTITVKF